MSLGELVLEGHHVSLGGGGGLESLGHPALPGVHIALMLAELRVFVLELLLQALVLIYKGGEAAR